MASNISSGRKNASKDNVGGIKAVYFVNFSASLLTGVTQDSNEIITALATSVDAFQFDLVGANSFEESNEVSRDNGTSFWTGTATLALKKQDGATQKELKLLSYGRPHALLEDYNGKYRLAGGENGCDVQINTASGAAMGDASGYTITVTSQEKEPALFVDSTAVGAGQDFDVQSAQIDPDA